MNFISTNPPKLNSFKFFDVLAQSHSCPYSTLVPILIIILALFQSIDYLYRNSISVHLILLPYSSPSLSHHKWSLFVLLVLLSSLFSSSSFPYMLMHPLLTQSRYIPSLSPLSTTIIQWFLTKYSLYSLNSLVEPNDEREKEDKEIHLLGSHSFNETRLSLSLSL